MSATEINTTLDARLRGQRPVQKLPPGRSRSPMSSSRSSSGRGFRLCRCKAWSRLFAPGRAPRLGDIILLFNYLYHIFPIRGQRVLVREHE